MKIYPRFITDNLKAALADTPVIFLNGPRQAGKSTLMEMLRKEQAKETLYFTLDDLATLDIAKKDPNAFLNRSANHIIIDEIQRAPELFLAIKLQVDKQRTPGRFLLTGSANIFLVPKIADSLAGRIELLTLYPLSLGELNGCKETLIDDLFSSNCWQRLQERTTPIKDNLTKQYLLDRIMIGGFPPVQYRETYVRRKAWFKSYITTLLERDVRELANIEGLRHIPNLLKLLATRTSNLLNFDELSRASALPATTLKRYFTLLQTFFVVHTLPAWSSNLGKRLIKSPKVYINDTGLLCNLLGLSQTGLMDNSFLWGSALETFVVNELMKIATWSKVSVNIYHYRTASAQEVDIVLESDDGQIVGIEVKATETPTNRDFNGLKDLKDNAGSRFICGVLLYLGNQVLSVGENLYAVPLLNGNTLG